MPHDQTTDPQSEDFTHLHGLLKAALNDDPHLRALLSNNLNTILNALALAPVGIAATAYVRRMSAPLSAETVRAWRALEAAVREYECEGGVPDLAERVSQADQFGDVK